MKRCLNANCETTFLYKDSTTYCPFCHGILINPARNNSLSDIEFNNGLVTVDTFYNENETLQSPEDAMEFIYSYKNKIECHGAVTEIDHHEALYSKRVKMIKTLFKGEPYQLAKQTTEYTIRVENITEENATQVTDFCMYGSYLGHIQVGDEVIIRAKQCRNRRVVKSIYNVETQSNIKPQSQIPAMVIQIIAAVILCLIVLFMCEVVCFVRSGAFIKGLTKLIVICVLLMIVFRRSIIRRIERRRRW